MPQVDVSVNITPTKIGFQGKQFVASLVFGIIFAGLSVFAVITALRPEAGIVSNVLGLVGILVLFGLFFHPSIVAFDLGYIDSQYKGLKHPYRWLILILNIFLGVTLIGWVFICVWAYYPNTLSVPVSVNAGSLESALNELQRLKDAGLITDDEYTRKRATLLT